MFFVFYPAMIRKITQVNFACVIGILATTIGCCFFDVTHAADAGASPNRAVFQIGSPFKGVFYENDFDYLDDDLKAFGDQRDFYSRLSDRWKDLDLNSAISLEIGGEFRTRFQSENNGALSRLDGLDNEFLLTRVRAYGNLQLGEHVRIFGEVIDGRAFGVDTAGRRPVAEAKGEVRNAFLEIYKSYRKGEIYVRGGRQEMLLGAQRFVSPLDWANSRRTFQGVRAGYRGPGLHISAFWTRPQLSNGVFDEGFADEGDFSGVYATWTRLRPAVIDAYVLHLKSNERLGQEFTILTVGARAKGRWGDVLGEIEAAIQTGKQDEANGGGDLNVRSFMTTLGIGYSMEGKVPFFREIWATYDIAQGDDDPKDGRIGTFNQLFPLAHAYFGHIDLIGRRNIEAINLLAKFRPHRRLDFTVGAHRFWRDSESDALYNAGGVAIRSPDVGSRLGGAVGSEIDVDSTVLLTQRATFSAGYAYFFAGDFIDDTNSVGVDGDAEFAYAELKFRF